MNVRPAVLCSCARPLQKVPLDMCNAVGAMYHPMPVPMRAHRAAEIQHLVTNRSGPCSAWFHVDVNFALPRPDAAGAPLCTIGPRAR